MDLKICFITTEFFGWEKFGGIGSATKSICEGLEKKGVKVSVVMPRSKGQKPLEKINGVEIYSHPLRNYLFYQNLFKKINADIYHSEEPSLGTIISNKTLPNSIHIATCQNPKNKEDWKLTIKYYKFQRKIYNILLDKWVNKNIKKLNMVYCQTKYIIPKSRKLYGLNYNPLVLPNPVNIKKTFIKKAENPTVCFLGRFDKEKQPEIFFKLAEKNEKINFIALGKAHDHKYDKKIREQFKSIKNLKMPGLVIGFEKEKILDSSWILINTSVHECLPISFLEASAHKCAILSPNDPEGFSSNFGFKVNNNNYSDGLQYLIKNNNWRNLADKGYNYVLNNHEINKVIQLHIKEYNRLLKM
ncbi:glycosyltransferase family 4 protein [Candidatus Bathyarchaeota archaeon]|nr:glycosyltransferase family 4 protein [Candidatus Bathyarchaeota archaeon]